MKQIRPQDARRALKRMWSAVAVYSCADGTLKVETVWNKEIYGTYSERHGGGPGLISRMHSAYMVECLLMLPNKRINWRKRSEKAKP